jgi:twitching motility protein PilT
VDRLISACPEGVHSQVSSVLSVLLRGVVAQQLCKLASGEGRTAVVEVLLRSYAVSNLIREGKVHQIDSYLRSGEQSAGMQSMDHALLRLIRDGLVTLDEGLTVAVDPAHVRSLIEQETASGAYVPPTSVPLS